MFTNKTRVFGLLVLLAHYTQTFVLLTASIDDIRKVARKFVSDSVAQKIADFIAQASGQKHIIPKPISAENEQNVENINDYVEDNELKNYKRTTKEAVEEEVEVDNPNEGYNNYNYEVSRHKVRKVPHRPSGASQLQDNIQDRFLQAAIESGLGGQAYQQKQRRPKVLREGRLKKKRPRQQNQPPEEQNDGYPADAPPEETPDYNRPQPNERPDYNRPQPNERPDYNRPQPNQRPEYNRPQKRLKQDKPYISQQKSQYLEKPKTEDLYEIVSKNPDADQYKSEETTRNMPPIMEADSQLGQVLNIADNLENRDTPPDIPTAAYDLDMPKRHRQKTRHRDRYVLQSNSNTEPTMIIEMSPSESYDLEPKLTTEKENNEFDQYDNLKYHLPSDDLQGQVTAASKEKTNWWESPLLRSNDNSTAVMVPVSTSDSSPSPGVTEETGVKE